MEKYKIILNLKSNIKFPENFLEYIFYNEYQKIGCEYYEVFLWTMVTY